MVERLLKCLGDLLGRDEVLQGVERGEASIRGYRGGAYGGSWDKGEGRDFLVMNLEDRIQVVETADDSLLSGEDGYVGMQSLGHALLRWCWVGGEWRVFWFRG